MALSAKNTKTTSELEEIEALFQNSKTPIEQIFNAQIIYQQAKGTPLEQGPCPDIQDQIDRWTKDPTGDWILDWEAARARALGSKPEPIEDDSKEKTPRMNDAYLLGTDHPDMQTLLQKPFTFMTGNMYGQKDRRNTLDGDWVRAELPLLTWMIGQDKGKNSWGLTRHLIAKHKEGSSIVLADAIDGARKDGAIKTMSCIGLDIDSGAALDDVITKLEEKGLFALVYTSFSHGKDVLILKHDDIMRKMKLEESPNRLQIQMYLREHHKDRFDAEFIETIEIKELRKQTPDGLRTVLKTTPLDKFRVILPLWESVELSELGATVNQWKDVWADAVTGVAVNMLDVNFDATSCDVNRLFFTPRHPKDAADWYCAVIQGRPLRFEEIEPYSKAAYVKNRDVNNDPFTAVGGNSGDQQREQFETNDGLNLNNWHRKYKDRFQLADVLETFCDDKIRVAGGEKPGTCHLECPFEDQHSSDGGFATMAMNPDENEYGYWTIFCKHDACQGRDKLEFVKEMVDQEWFDESILTDEDWCIPLPDDETLGDVSPDTAPLPLSAPLWEDDLVIDGRCKPKDAGKIRTQIRERLRDRVSYVIVEGGKCKLFLHPKRGQMPEIWDETGLDKFFRNNRPFYKKKDEKQVVINPATEFMGDPDRITYSGTQFEPDLNKADKTKYNTFNGFPVSPVKGDWSLMRGHIKDNLCVGNGASPEEDEYLFNYVMTWCADMFQNPGRKLGSSIAIIGEQGVGKSKFFDWLREGLGGYAVKVASKKHLVGNFNQHLDSKLLVVAEEAFWSGDKEAASILKDFITSDTYMTETISTKGQSCDPQYLAGRNQSRCEQSL